METLDLPVFNREDVDESYLEDANVTGGKSDDDETLDLPVFNREDVDESYLEDESEGESDDAPIMISPGLMSGGGAMLFSRTKKDKEDDGKVERSKAELMRLKWQAETGQNDGAFRYGFSAVPFVGGSFKEDQKDKLNRMRAFADGKPQLRGRVVDGRTVTPQEAAEAEVMTASTMGIQPDETTLDAMWADEAQYLGISPDDSGRKEGESRFDYRERLKNLVNDSLRQGIVNKAEAQRELANTHETITDKIVVGGLPSIGYMGEMAAGGLLFKGVQGAKLGFDLLTKEGVKQLLTKEGAKQFGKFAAKKVAHDSLKAAPATAAGTARGVRELSRDEYGLDEKGNVIVAAEGDKGFVGGKAFLNSYAENLLENLVGDVTQPVAVKLFGLIGKTGKVGKFVNEAYRNYNKIRDVTSFGDILFEELPEENVQYFFSDVLGWGKKDSEYRGVFDELKHAFTDEGGQYTLGGQWNTALAMLMQMGVQAAIAGVKTGKHRVDEKRNIGNVLESVGLTKDQVSKMSLGQRDAFARLYSKWSRDPAAFEDALKLAGGFIGEHANELMEQSTYRTEDGIKEYGETPRGFKFQYKTDESGRQTPVFEKELYTNPLTDEQSVRDVMVDAESGVSIADNGDGTYSVSDGMREEHFYETDNFDAVKRVANFYALKAQRNRLDNDRKREYARQLLATKFKRNAIVADHVSNIYHEFKNNIDTYGEHHGVKNLDQLFVTDENGKVVYPPKLRGGNATGGFACPDGTIAVILDNIVGPKDMVRVLSHESGHVSGYEDNDKRLSFLKKADPNSEYGRVLANLRAINEENNLGRSEDSLVGEAFSVWLQERGHNPSVMQKLHNVTLGKLGKVGDAELEVLANQIERQSESGEGYGMDIDDRVSFVPGVSFESVHADEGGESPADVPPTPSADTNVPMEGVKDATSTTTQETPVDAPEEIGGATAPQEDETPAEGEFGASAAIPDETGEKKPVSERTIIEKLTDEVKPDDVAIDEIEVSDSRIPQFKEGADPTTGEVEPLTGEPYDLVSNPIVVMEFKDGKKVVVTGRHRYGLYKRSGRKTISARVIREADGWTVDDAMAIDAIGNIIDEKGTEKDYVKYFDNAKPTRAEAKTAGFLDREKGKRAFSIFEGATEDTKELIDWEVSGSDGKISVAQAGIIAEAAPKDANPRFAAVQRVLVKKALAGVGGKKLGVLARSLAEEAKNRKDALKVEGGTQLDLFTSEEDLALLALEEKRADYRTRKSSEYDRIAEVLRTAIRKGGKLDLNEEFAKELGITDTKDKKQLSDAWTKAKERANYWENAPTLDEADKTAMDAEINAKAEAAAKKLADAKAKREAKIPDGKHAETQSDSEKLSLETTTQSTQESVWRKRKKEIYEKARQKFPSLPNVYAEKETEEGNQLIKAVIDAEESRGYTNSKHSRVKNFYFQDILNVGKRLSIYLRSSGLSEKDIAKATVLTAFYTPIEMVRIEHDALRRIGVLGGRFLGPSAGVGNYASAAGLYDKDVAWQFVEKDIVSGQILKALFPNQRVHIGGYEETKFADSFFDFAIDNVPYGDINITDKSLMKEPLKIHDYFFAKTLSKLRPGGVMMFLTSTGTLDKTDGKLRQFLSKNGGKIIGAVRLPNGFFSKNAGTDVASDLIIIQRQECEADNFAFMQSQKYGEGSEYVRRKGQVKVDLTYNKYFAEHPEQIIGEMKVGSGQYGRTMLEYKMPMNGMYDLVRAAIDRAMAGVDKDALMKNAPKAVQKDHTPIYDSEGLRQGNITVKDGVIYEKSGDELVKVSHNLDTYQKKIIALKGLTPVKVVEKILEVRKALRDVVDAEVKGVDDETLQPLLDKLNEVYDAFVKKCGTFHGKEVDKKAVAKLVLLDKADGNRLLSLENVRKVGDDTVVEKADIFKKRVIFTHARPTRANTVEDALIISYSETATVDAKRIGELLGISAEEAEKRLKESGKAFENPQTGKIEPYWEYLSGHVRRKLEAARAATANDQSFRKNVEELEKVQPEDVPLDKVNIKFGATWVDPEAMTDFIREVYDLGEYAKVKVEYNETTGKWDVEIPRSDVEPFGATTFSQEHFLSAILNHKSLEVKEKDDVTGKYYLLEKETEAQKLAAEKLHEAFARFLRTNEKWFEPSGKSYNYIMNDNVPMILPKNILPLRPAGMSEEAIRKISAEGREYQPDVIARGVMGGKSLCLAHCVGAGKTLEMQTIGMVGRHLGMFKKPMYVVPNHMLNQFCNEFLEAFPNANLLKMSTDDVNPKNRRAFFAKVANGDWDAIIVKHSTYSQKLPMTKEWQKQYLDSQKEKLLEAKLAARGDKGTVKDIEKLVTGIENKLKKLDNSETKDDQIVPFEELGVDQLFIDEAHNFKGLPIVSSQARNVKGLDQGDSQRALDMEMKALYVQSLHGGKRGVVFATGTPLSNAPVVEAYVMLRVLAPYALEEQGIKHFDDFVNTFGNITTESEFGIDGKSTKEVSRVTSFVNIPEMMRLFKSVVDIVNSDQIKVKRPKEKLVPVPVKMSDAQAKIMKMVADESAIPASKEEKGKFLTLSGIAKRACISPRLVGIDDDGFKLAACAENVKRKYDETSDVRGAQLVFTDIFNSSDAEGVQRYVGSIEGLKHSPSSWNLNKHLKELLVKSGIPAEQIAIIQDIDNVKGGDEAKSAAKEELFAKVRSGEIRVLIGSRQRMGEGTNVQERLCAIHLLHPGWKPAEDIQAKGREIRPGNMFEVGEIYYYLTQGNEEVGSYETKNHELVGVKDRLIQAVMHGDESIREIDLDTETAERDMLMGLASANEDLIKLIDVRRVLHKAELNIESVLFSARSNEDNASRTERQLERMKDDFAEQEKGAKEWREKNPDKSFVLTTADGRLKR